MRTTGKGERGEERKSNEVNMKDVGGKNKEGAKVDPF